MRENIVKYAWIAQTILVILFIVWLATLKNWLGIIIMMIALGGVQLWRFKKQFPLIRSVMLHSIKQWERQQLGYDLDDPYWDGKKRPTLMQKLKGINPNEKK